jgi:hypothetical protein
MKMKKIIGLLVIMFVTTGVFGQINLNDLSDVEHGEWLGKMDILHFTTELQHRKFFYILAYEPNFGGAYNGTKRNVYLYCMDITPENPNEKYKRQPHWIRVSDAVLVNYFRDSHNYQDVDFYTYNKDRHNTSNGSVRLDGNDVIFNLEIHKMENGGMSVTQQTIVLELIRNTFDGRFYTVKR